MKYMYKINKINSVLLVVLVFGFIINVLCYDICGFGKSLFIF